MKSIGQGKAHLISTTTGEAHSQIKDCSLGIRGAYAHVDDDENEEVYWIPYDMILLP